MLPAPADIHYFLELANTLNMSRAAERLGVRQPTISLAVKRLEDAVGVPLFVRTKTGVQLTRGGRRFLQAARELLEQWHHVQSTAQREEQELSGRYTLGVHASVALETLPRFLPPLLESYPSLQIDLVHDHSRKIAEEIVRFKIDFGIVVNPTPHPDLAIRQLYLDEVTLFTSSTPTALQDPSDGQGVLLFDPELHQTQKLQRAMSRRNLRFARTIPTTNLDVIAALTAAGAGIGVLPARVAARAGGGALCPLDPDLPKVRDRHCLVSRADAQNSKASRTLSRFIQRHLSD